MPLYCYVCEKCQFTDDRFAAMKDSGQFVPCPNCNGAMQRDYETEQGGRRSIQAGWPMMSEACAVDPDQIPEATATMKALGVPTEFSREGCPIFRDRSHRKKFLESQGMFDKDGGYSDPQPK